MQKMICAVYGEGAVTDQMCQKRFAKFRAGDFPLDDAPWLGRPVEVDSNQIETLTESNQRHTTRETTNILKISKSIKLLAKMRNVSFILQKKYPYGLFGHPNTSVFRHLPSESNWVVASQLWYSGAGFVQILLVNQPRSSSDFNMGKVHRSVLWNVVSFFLLSLGLFKELGFVRTCCALLFSFCLWVAAHHYPWRGPTC